jgi:hypothetical protein
MNRTSLAAKVLMTATLLSVAPVAEAMTVQVSKDRIAHQIEAARSAQDRLQMHSDRFCTSNCLRMKVDIGIVEQALQNFNNQITFGLLDGKDKASSKVVVKRIQHQFESVRSALGRLEWVASRQTDQRRRRVEIDVSILTQVVQNMENQAVNALRAQAR